MYDLDNVSVDFPWTSSELEPNGFSYVPEGWGDVVYEYLQKLEAELDRLGIKDEFYTEQIKEKWGTLRFSYFISASGEFSTVQEIISELEDATSKICCYCGTDKDVRCRGGWVHFSCDKCEDEHEK